MNDPIDEALREYVGCAMPFGMEARILTRCRRRSRRWPVLGLVAAAAGVMCLVYLRPAEPARPVFVRPLIVEQKPAVSIEVPVRKAKRRHTESGVQALWRFAQVHPEVVLSMVANHQTEPVLPLQIEPIAIDEPGEIQQ